MLRLSKPYISANDRIQLMHVHFIEWHKKGKIPQNIKDWRNPAARNTSV